MSLVILFSCSKADESGNFVQLCSVVHLVQLLENK